MNEINEPSTTYPNSHNQQFPGPLMIVGSPRSGTTFLARTINRFLNIHIARDAGVFVRFYRALPAYGPLTDSANVRRLINDLYRDMMFRTRFLERGLTLSEADLFNALTERSFAGLVRQIFVETAHSHGKSYWGNKRPSYALHLAETEAIFPGGKIVHIVRDGRDVVLSMRKATHMLVEKNWYFAASDWKKHVLLARRAGQDLGRGRYLEIKYESLLADPVGVFRTLLEFMEMGADTDAQLERIRVGIGAKLRPDNHGKWRTQMPDKAVRVVERVAGDLLEELGYQLKFTAVARTRFTRAQIGLFYIDRAIRNVFMRDFKKFVRAHLNLLTSAGRARISAFRRNAARVIGSNDEPNREGK